MNLIKSMVMLVAGLVWLVMGFYLWIPAIVIASILYAVGLLAVALLSEPRLERATSSLLQDSISFYCKGFRRITQAAHGEFKNDSPEFESAPGTFFFFLVATVFSLGLATVFWYCLVYIVRLFL